MTQTESELAPACGECGLTAYLVGGDLIYPHRRDLAEMRYWLCICGAYCGVHRGTIQPLGAPAGAETRRARSAAHAAFDPLWKKRQQLSSLSKTKARGLGYKWLAAELGIKRSACHIGMMDAATAWRVVEICRGIR